MHNEKFHLFQSLILSIPTYLIINYLVIHSCSLFLRKIVAFFFF